MRRLISAFILTTVFLPDVLLAGDAAGEPDDVIALVGDQPITFSQVNTLLNSSAVVGVSIPALGTPERDTVRIALLDKIVSANLLYLDALRKGADKDPEYQRDIRRFENGILSGLYEQRELIGDIRVTEDEIQAFYKESVAPGTELTDEGRAQIEAAMRKRKADEARADLGPRVRALRESLGVAIHEENIVASGDAERPDGTPVAEVGGETITWGEVKSMLIAAGKGAIKRDILAMEEEGRLATLNAEVDTRVLARKAREAGLDKDPVYLQRVAEYKKTRLINLYRSQLALQFEPSESELVAYFEANKARITVPEARKVQMVVVETEVEANEIKEKIESGEITIYEAARDFSIDPGAKQNLGEIGWVKPGEGQPALSKATFALEPDEIGGPIETPAGWHLLKVTDLREERYGDIKKPDTRKQARRAFIHDKLNTYVVDLRKNTFEVEVYEDNLIRLAQAESDMVKKLAEQAAQPGSVTQKRLEEMQKAVKK